jgi:hypothetical protein
MIVPEVRMTRRTLLTLLALASLTGCHRKQHSSTSAASRPPTVGLSVSARTYEFGENFHGTQFLLQGRITGKIQAALLHVTAEGAVEKTRQEFLLSPAGVDGSLWLTMQKGDPFGKPDQRLYALGESIPAATKLTSSTGPILLQGPFALEAEHLETVTPMPMQPGQERVLYARCLSKKSGAHSFGSGDVEFLKKHAAEMKDDIVVVTLRWDP